MAITALLGMSSIDTCIGRDRAMFSYTVSVPIIIIAPSLYSAGCGRHSLSVTKHRVDFRINIDANTVSRSISCLL